MRLWDQASSLAAQTPEERNRYVDFLRSVSILVVMLTAIWRRANFFRAYPGRSG